MIQSQTRSATDTYTEARARYVMGKVYDDLINLMNAGFITKSYADEIRRDILYLLDKKALKFFELQFKCEGKEDKGLRYEVKSDQSVSLDDESGNINFWGLETGTIVYLVIRKDSACPRLAEVNAQLTLWGWGTGTCLTGNADYAKSYSKDGFGLKQSIIGKW